MIELDELSTFAWSLDTLRPLKHPLDPHLYPKSVGYTAKVSIEVQSVFSCFFVSCSGKSTPHTPYLFGKFRSSCSTEELLGSGKQNRSGWPTHSCRNAHGGTNYRTYKRIPNMRIQKIEGRYCRSRRKKATANKKRLNEKGHPYTLHRTRPIKAHKTHPRIE